MKNRVHCSTVCSSAEKTAASSPTSSAEVLSSWAARQGTGQFVLCFSLGLGPRAARQPVQGEHDDQMRRRELEDSEAMILCFWFADQTVRKGVRDSLKNRIQHNKKKSPKANRALKRNNPASKFCPPGFLLQLSCNHPVDSKFRTLVRYRFFQLRPVVWITHLKPYAACMLEKAKHVSQAWCLSLHHPSSSIMPVNGWCRENLLRWPHVAGIVLTDCGQKCHDRL